MKAQYCKVLIQTLSGIKSFEDRLVDIVNMQTTEDKMES